MGEEIQVLIIVIVVITWRLALIAYATEGNATFYKPPYTRKHII